MLGQGGHLQARERSRGLGSAVTWEAGVLGEEPSPILPPCPHSQLQLQSLKIGFPGAGQARALGGAADIGRAPRQVPSPGLDTIIPGPMPVPTRIRIELSKVRSAGARLLGSTRPVHRRGRAVRLQRFGNAGYRGVLSGPPLRRSPPAPRVPSAEWPAEARGSARTPPAPSRGKLQLIRFFAALRSDLFLFCLVLEG